MRTSFVCLQISAEGSPFLHLLLPLISALSNMLRVIWEMHVHVCVCVCVCVCVSACVCGGRRMMLVRHLCVLRASFWCLELCVLLFVVRASGSVEKGCSKTSLLSLLHHYTYARAHGSRRTHTHTHIFTCTPHAYRTRTPRIRTAYHDLGWTNTTIMYTHTLRFSLFVFFAVIHLVVNRSACMCMHACACSGLMRIGL